MRRTLIAKDEGAQVVPPDLAARALLLIAILAYGCVAGWASLRNHYGFGTFGFDLGIFDQGMWLLSRFEDPFVTVMGVDLFGDHTSFILLLLVPLYWVAPSPAVLLIAQTVALAMAAVPAFLLAREKLRSEMLAAGMAAAYLLHPAVAWTNWENFHPDSFEVPLAFTAIYLMVKQRWGAYLLALAGLLLVKEDVALMTFGLGVYVAIRHDRRIGLITAGVSALWFGACVWLILPAFNGVGTLDAFRVPFGGPRGLATAVISRPGDVIDLALRDGKAWYVWQLLAPLALLSMLAPSFLAVAIGPLLSNLLSTFWYQYQIEYHYTTLIIPVVVSSMIFGIARFRPRWLRRSLVACALAASTSTAYLWGPLPWAREPGALAGVSPRRSSIQTAFDKIPQDASVSAFYSFVPHLAHRTEIYEFPNPWHAQNWGDWSKDGSRLPMADTIDYVIVPDDVTDKAAEVLERIRPEFEVAFYRDGILLLKRVA